MDYQSDEFKQMSSIPVTRDITPEEMETAQQIYEAYCEFRRTRGLNVLQWDADFAGKAFMSACRCAKTKTLTHRLGFNDEDQKYCSDILQYSIWRMPGIEVVDRWAHSDGHRKMMQCDSAMRCGVGVYKDDDEIWYYSLVYDFMGCNQSGN